MLRLLLLATSLWMTSGGCTLHAAETLDAEDFRLGDYRGKLVYLDFWASWCTPCRASFPFMAELARKHAQDLAVVAVNVDTVRADAIAFMQQFETPFDVVFDPEGRLASEHAVPGMPTTFLFDREGRLLGRHVGFRNKDRDGLRDWVEQGIGE